MINQGLKSNAVAEYLSKMNSICFSHPSYTPDLSQFDFFSFPEFEETFKGKSFFFIRDSGESYGGNFEGPAKNGSQHAFEGWKKMWDKYITCNGEYFDKSYQNLEDSYR
ncbi:hypothetical protein AVEN_95992-1 [Araneus ventricosus]|uniref:Histone-lysine N-methyltransferase SETMAR n=1 Tax=Araneus ventricosus TaxID=182803 RepID=A0A4Y2B6R3_ARAVE|nr:hypothetical protein AVEN_95992-1 [Araneus ventricosus]